MTEATEEGVQNSAFDETDFGAVETDLEARKSDDVEENNDDKEEVWKEDLDDFQVNLLEDYDSVAKEDRNFIYLLFKPIIWCARVISNNSKIAEWCFYSAFVIGNCHYDTCNLIFVYLSRVYNEINRLHYFHWICIEAKFWRRSYPVGARLTVCCPPMLGQFYCSLV